MGMYVRVPPSANTGPDVFVRLAKGYVVPEKPTKKKEACALNAEVSAIPQIVKYAVEFMLSSSGCCTSWEHTRCSGVDLARITFNGHRSRICYRFIGSSREGGPTAFARSLSFSAECSPFK